MKIDPTSVPFKRVLKCNIGNPQSLKQKPLSFVRDVLSITLNPSLVEFLFFPLGLIEWIERALSIPS
jgi:hypothetical protein